MSSERELIERQVEGPTFEAFVEEVEPRIRHALIGWVGVEDARDATAEALAYGWENWQRLSAMSNPAGYLYRVAQSAARRATKKRPLLPEVPTHQTPWVEPGLPSALASLTSKQRISVWVINGLGWTANEASALLGISPESIRTHVRRGMEKLRKALEVSDAG